MSEVYILCAQHLVSTSYSLFHTLLQLGLQPSNLSAIGKCYSTNPEAVAEMQKLGIDICESSLSFNSHTSFDQQYKQNIKKFIRSRILTLKNSRFKKIVVLDDGGELLLEANTTLGDDPRLIGIEQTSSGHRKIKQQKLNFPVINVARSPAKLNHESPIIAKLVLKSLIVSLTSLDLKPEKALVIGNGPIGAHISRVLEPTHETLVFDKAPSKSYIKPENLQNALETSDLIIGCTGTTVLDSKEFDRLKKNAILVSASSSDREFKAQSLRKRIPLVSDCHQHLLIEDKWLINCGFPINFSSNFREVDSDELQLTRSLLLSAILQATNELGITANKRLVSLDPENQRDILLKYYSLFQKEDT
ncbi:MAG: hypothetical protein P0S93_00420 [Candidatus Neptunochlamydia sp.]|nr:hypothetical protein [Candidatus Neptunochlamydia sp.]